MLCAHCGQPDSLMDTPGAGAAGGTPFGLMAATQARVLPGAELVAAWLNLDTRLAAADLVLTGEGRFDESSVHGKGPGNVVSRALGLGIETHVFAGEVFSGQKRRGLTLHAVTPPGTPLAAALRDTATNLAAAVRGAF
jgi:glycerate kinase